MSRAKPKKDKGAPADPACRVEEIHNHIVVKGTAEMQGLLEILGSKKRLIWLNFLAGLGRGVGFFLGVTLVGGAIIGLAAFSFDMAASTLGLKDVTFRQAVQSVYTKYLEVKSVIEDVQERRAAEEQSTTESWAGLPKPPPSFQEPYTVPVEEQHEEPPR